MKAHIEPLSGVIRIYKEGSGFIDQDPYEWCATIRWRDHETIEIMGVTSPPTVQMWKAIKELLKDESSGINRVEIVRHGRRKTLKVHPKENK